MGTEETVLRERSEPAAWVSELEEAFAPGRKTAELTTPDFRFVDYPYQRQIFGDQLHVQNALTAPVLPRPDAESEG